MAFQPMTNPKWMVGGDRALPVPVPEGSLVPSPTDLCCMEDWDKESPSKAASSLPRGAAGAARPPAAVAAGGATAAARLPTPSERAQLRRARPVDAASRGSRSSFVTERSRPPPGELVDTLRAMLRAQGKFAPAGVSGATGSRARCHGVSPFVAERRGLFVAWENEMATFFKYNRDTVAVALNYFDRYTCATPCAPTLAQAVAATALHVAAKFEETQPASLRELLKFTPVFNPEQLLLMEMSMLKVLNWDLRPVTVYDFVRVFCALLVPGAVPTKRSSAAAAAAAGSRHDHPETKPKPTVTLQSKEDKEKELERLRVGAEEIADLASFEVTFVDFLPSTLAMSALLLSVSRGAPAAPSSSSSSSTSLPPTSHFDVLDACWKPFTPVPASAEDPEPAANTKPKPESESDGGGGGVPLRRLLECVELLGSSLSQRYPSVAVAAEAAAEGIARYAGWPMPSSGCGVAAAAPAAPCVGGAKKAGAPQVSTTPVAVAKSRRCATPTGVEGIMHIEMDAIRGTGGGGGDDDDSNDADRQGTQKQQQKPSPNEALGGTASGTSGGAPDGPAGAGDGDEAATAGGSQQPQQNRLRPSAFTKTAAATTAAIAPEQQHKRRSRVRADSFAYTDEDIAYARASKRSADALGHSESGSGFGAPASRCGRVGTATAGGGGGGHGSKAAKLSRSPPSVLSATRAPLG